MVVYAAVYKTKVVSKFPQEIGEGEEVAESECGDDLAFEERKYGLLAVFERGRTSACVWSFFCTPVLAAKNYEVSRVLGFWPSCLCLGFLMYSPLYCVAVLIRTMLSARLKRKMKYEPRFFKDCMMTCFCLPCEVGRESLEVD